jgi:arsenical pump membrane protein
VFDWLAALAFRGDRGSPNRLFALVYAVGMIVTVFLSNDATAVSLRPPCTRRRGRQAQRRFRTFLFVPSLGTRPALSYPSQNPANLVIFGSPPPLVAWLGQFALPSVISIIARGEAAWRPKSSC